MFYTRQQPLSPFRSPAALEEGYATLGIGAGLYQDYSSAQRLYCRLGYLPDGKGVTYNDLPAVPGAAHPVDDELILWLTKTL